MAHIFQYAHRKTNMSRRFIFITIKIVFYFYYESGSQMGVHKNLNKAEHE